jgi:hypothetical protein
MVFHSWHSGRVRPHPKHHPLGPENSQMSIQGLFCFFMLPPAKVCAMPAQHRFQVAADG